MDLEVVPRRIRGPTPLLQERMSGCTWSFGSRWAARRKDEVGAPEGVPGNDGGDRWFIRTYRLARRRRRCRRVAEDGAVGCTFDGCLYSGDRSHDAEAGIRASPCPHAADQPAAAGRPAFASVLAGRRHAPASFYSCSRLFFLIPGFRIALATGARCRNQAGPTRTASPSRTPAPTDRFRGTPRNQPGMSAWLSQNWLRGNVAGTRFKFARIEVESAVRRALP